MKNNLSEMMCLDLYLSELQPEEYNHLKHFIKPSKKKIMPLLSWDIYSQYFYNQTETLRQENDIKEVKKLAKTLHWTNDFDAIFHDQSFEALVITDHNKKIVWVNNGFVDMTGYPKKFAIDKTPAFLQGEGTSMDTKERIRENLQENKPFTEVIINYKKDNTPYKCEIKIVPLDSGDAIYYLALEKQVG
tara:strand:+ start:60533 stop:61099 length:567 start_codon:yes stop_codon:yes gene_type:complete